MIRIYTEKIWINDEQGYKVVKIDALEMKDLPQKYTDSECRAIKTKDGELLIRDKDWYYILQLNSVFTKKNFYIVLDHIRKCGDNLKKVKDDWKGTKRFVI